MLELIKEIETALDYNLFHVALGMALTLPDICGNIEYKNKRMVKERYVKWCESYLHNQGFMTSNPRVISGDVCYQLRCAILHSGNLNLKNKYCFLLRISSSKDKGIYVEPVSSNKSKYIELDVRHLCHVLCNAAKEYYNQHKKKEDFEEHNYKILDIQQEFKKMTVK